MRFPSVSVCTRVSSISIRSNPARGSLARQSLSSSAPAMETAAASGDP
ncbi:MAG: hypothetical protein ACRD30_02705 [Bryobacteraceae bacterium]